MSSDPTPLDDLRRSIDLIDEAMLDMLEKRFAVVAQVKSAKASGGDVWPTPLRPAREMQILRRLISRAEGRLPTELVFQVWRTIVNEASLVQSPVTIHVSKKLANQSHLQLMIRDHFGRFTVSICKDEAQAMVQVQVEPRDICIVETTSDWVDSFQSGKAGKAQIISTLPALASDPVPQLLVIGVAPQQASGQDETLLISKGSLPRDFPLQPAWQIKTGSYRLSALPGFVSEHESPIIGLTRSNKGLGLVVAGRYPIALAAQS